MAVYPISGVAAEFTRTSSSVPGVEGRMRLSVERLEGLGEAPSLVDLRTRTAAMLPRVDLPDLLLERPAAMPLDAYREGDRFVVHLDLAGVDAESIDLQVDRNTLTVHAARPAVRGDNQQMLVAEGPTGTFTRQLFLGDSLDSADIEANYNAG